MLYISRSSSQYKDLQPTGIARDETDVKSIISVLQPLQSTCSRPRLSLNRKGAIPEVEYDLLQAKDIGEKVYKSLPEQRLQFSPSKVKFHDTITKAKLKTFPHLNKKVSVKAGRNQEVIIKADRRLFAPNDCHRRKQKLADERSVVPSFRTILAWSLAIPDSLMRKTNKVSLAKELQNKFSLRSPRQVQLMEWP